MRLDFIIFSAGILQRMFLVCPEVLGWAISEEGFKQFASVINFGVCVEKIHRDM